MAIQTTKTFVVTLSATSRTFATRELAARFVQAYAAKYHLLPVVTEVVERRLCACEVADMADTLYLVRFHDETFTMSHREYQHMAMAVSIGRATAPAGVSLCVKGDAKRGDAEYGYEAWSDQFAELVRGMMEEKSSYFATAADAIADAWLAEFPEFLAVVVEDEVVADADACDIPS